MRLGYRQAVMAVIIKNGKVLIGSSPRDGGYKFPQGGIDEGETNFQAIKREVMEEIGLNLKDSYEITELESVKYTNPKNRKALGQEQVVFKIKYDPTMNIEPQDDEFKEIIWIEPSDLSKYNTKSRTPAYEKALELCGLK